MPQGCHNGNGIYTHRSEINLRRTGRKPYASIAAISGLQMVGMSLFKEAGLSYDESLHQNIHQHYLNSATDSSLNIAYAFGNADRLNDADISRRHAIIKLNDPKKGLSGRGPGYVCPTGMDGIGAYEIVFVTSGPPQRQVCACGFLSLERLQALFEILDQFRTGPRLEHGIQQ